MDCKRARSDLATSKWTNFTITANPDLFVFLEDKTTVFLSEWGLSSPDLSIDLWPHDNRWQFWKMVFGFNCECSPQSLFGFYCWLMTFDLFPQRSVGLVSTVRHCFLFLIFSEYVDLNLIFSL